MHNRSLQNWRLAVFWKNKTVTQCNSGIIVEIQDYELSVVMLGNVEPGTTSKFTFPHDFHYLDSIEPSHELDLGGERKLDSTNVCVQLSDDRRVLCYIIHRRLWSYFSVVFFTICGYKRPLFFLNQGYFYFICLKLTTSDGSFWSFMEIQNYIFSFFFK